MSVRPKYRRHKEELKAAETHASRSAKQSAQQLADVGALVASLKEEKAVLSRRFEASHKHAESVVAKLKVSNAANIPNEVLGAQEQNGTVL